MGSQGLSRAQQQQGVELVGVELEGVGHQQHQQQQDLTLDLLQWMEDEDEALATQARAGMMLDVAEVMAEGMRGT